MDDPRPIFQPKLTLLHLFGLTTLTAGWLSLFVFCPHIAIFLGPLITSVSSIALLRKNRHSAFAVRCPLLATVLFSLMALYVVSMGPVVALDEATLRLGPPVLGYVYFPVVWFHNAGLFKEEIEWYGLQWGWT